MTTSRILIAGALFSAPVFFVCAFAQAEEAKVRLDVRADPSLSESNCPTREALATAVRGLLERDAIDESADALVRVEIATRGSTFEANLTLEVQGRVVGTRQVVRRGASCAVLEGPLAVVVALLIDVAEGSIRIVVPPAPPPPPPPKLSSPPPARWTLANELAASMLVGLFPNASPGLRVGLEVARESFALAGRFEFYPTSSATFGGIGGEFRAGWASAGVCFQPGSSWLRLHACALASFGAAMAHATSVRVSTQSIAPLVLLEPELGGRVRAFGPLWLTAAASLIAGLQPRDWYVASGTSEIVIYRPWAASLIVAIGARAAF